MGLDGNSPVLGSIQTLETRLARSRLEIQAAQALRFKVFYQEKSAIADATTRLTRRDKDDYDQICDHLLVLDRQRPEHERIVATYRLLRQDIAEQHDGFYSAQEFDVKDIVDSNRNFSFLELGRSCVLPRYRSKRTVELLWQGTWSYVLRNKIDVMIGCASLDGTNPQKLALPLSFLHHYARAPQGWRVFAANGKGAPMNRLTKLDIDTKTALRQLPPMIKGYLRLGAWIGEEAVVDQRFGTTDVLIILPVSNLNPRYVRYYGSDASRHAS